MNLSIVFGVFLLKDSMASIPNSGRSFTTEVMNTINRQSILQHTIAIAKTSFSEQIAKSFMKLRSYQQEIKGTMTKYNFSIQEA
ncbi:2020_t:CDS:2, partial [Funneliformis caledonium]